MVVVRSLGKRHNTVETVQTIEALYQSRPSYLRIMQRPSKTLDV
jgi:hypothetical protein